MTPTHACFELWRTLATPPTRIWHALTDPAARAAWGPPSPDEVVIFDATDVREDRPPPLRPPRRARNACRDPLAATRRPGNRQLNRNVEARRVSLVTYALTATDSGTELATHVAVSSFVGDDLAQAHRTGWTHALDNLAAHHKGVPA